MATLIGAMKTHKEYYPFHPDFCVNYQLNRWYNLGYAPKSEIESIAAGIRSWDDFGEALEKVLHWLSGRSKS